MSAPPELAAPCCTVRGAQLAVRVSSGVTRHAAFAPLSLRGTRHAIRDPWGPPPIASRSLHGQRLLKIGERSAARRTVTRPTSPGEGLMRSRSVRPLTLLGIACASLGFAAIRLAAQQSDTSHSYVIRLLAPERSDSVVLERQSGCWTYESCPAYRLRVSRSGDVTVRTTYPGRRVQVFSWNVSTDSVNRLLETAAYDGLMMLPNRIADVPAYCPAKSTDFGGAIVSFFGPGWSKQIDDYHGCQWAPVALREFEDLVDRIAGVSQHAPEVLVEPH
jgi:hypothetical protein